MQKVYKYVLDFDDYCNVILPVGYKLLDVKVQNGNPVLWALVNPNEIHSKIVRFRIAGTGHPIEENELGYVATFEYNELIFHVFSIL